MSQTRQPPWPMQGLGDVPPRANVRLPPDVEDQMEALVDLGLFQTNAEFAREGLRDVLREPDTPQAAAPEVGSTDQNRITIRFTPEMAAGVQALVEDPKYPYPNKSAAIRDAIQRVLSDYEGVLSGDNFPGSDPPEGINGGRR